MDDQPALPLWVAPSHGRRPSASEPDRFKPAGEVRLTCACGMAHAVKPSTKPPRSTSGLGRELDVRRLPCSNFPLRRVLRTFLDARSCSSSGTFARSAAILNTNRFASHGGIEPESSTPITNVGRSRSECGRHLSKFREIRSNVADPQSMSNVLPHWPRHHEGSNSRSLRPRSLQTHQPALYRDVSSRSPSLPTTTHHKHRVSPRAATGSTCGARASCGGP